MERLLEFPLEDNAEITRLRREGGAALGLALAKAGCGVEAAQILRPTRKSWAGDDDADYGSAALKTIAWWNKSWREVAKASQAGRFDRMNELLGDRVLRLWDQPPLLMHLSRAARAKDDLALVRHVLQRLLYLSERGVPKIDMAVFRYAAQAELVDTMADDGDVAGALKAYETLTPNPGNAFAHEIQGAKLLALSGRADETMHAVAVLLVTADKKRKGWSADVRKDFVENSPALDPLRQRPDWAAMCGDPAKYLKS